MENKYITSIIKQYLGEDKKWHIKISFPELLQEILDFANKPIIKMNNKYFTPSIEDIRVGYECEIREILNNKGIYSRMMGEEESYTKYYKPVIVGKTYPIPEHRKELTLEMFESCVANLYNQHLSLSHAVNLLNKKKLRVPYLTKEQIEAEGWREIHDEEYIKKNKNDVYVWFNNNANSEYLSQFKIHNKGNILYMGECDDINTFRYISKLLNIK